MISRLIFNFASFRVMSLKVKSAQERAMRERLASLKNRAKQLINKHGAEVGVVAKIAANALIPGAPMIVGAVEAVCGYPRSFGGLQSPARS